VNIFAKFIKKDNLDCKNVVMSKSRELSGLGDGDLFSAVNVLVNSKNWKYLEEKLWRVRDIRESEFLLASDMHEVGKIKGWIKAIDWLLQLSENKL